MLNKVLTPKDLRNLPESSLPQLCDNLREFLINTISKTGGHLGASLGAVEITVALHYVFNTPEDKLLFDVSHQSYIHKILTSRKDKLQHIRQEGGIAGFTRRSESEYDAFGAAHSSTSISAAIGFVEAYKILNKPNKHVVAIIGDGALSAGLAYEGLNNLGSLGSKMIIVLNDNGMSIAPAVGAMDKYLQGLRKTDFTADIQQLARNVAMKISQNLPRPIRKVASLADNYAINTIHHQTLFEHLGCSYHGPFDGHNVNELVKRLRICKETVAGGPILLHILTNKGHGYTHAEEAEEKYHGVGQFDIKSGSIIKSRNTPPSYTAVFSSQLIEHAKKQPKIVAISAAMPSGTGLNAFAKAFPDRFFDVGIAEQHAVTFAAGLACEGIIPVVAIYSTFLQRAYDQIIHDVSLQQLPVRFIIDRAGYVGADGPSHVGAYDISMLACLPEMVIMAPSNEAELAILLTTQLAIDDRPSALRFPRGASTGVDIPDNIQPVEIGKARWIRNGEDGVIIAIGTILSNAIEASDILAKDGILIAVADARFAKPVDAKLIACCAKKYNLLVTIEEAAIGGFATQVLDVITNQGLNQNCDILNIHMPDRIIEHASSEQQLSYAGLDSKSIAQRIKSKLSTSAANSKKQSDSSNQA